MKKQYYIYTHSINGKVFYVGSNFVKGNPNRAYEKFSRPKKWYEIVEKNNWNYDIEIVDYFDTGKQAARAETELIYHYHDIGQAEASGEDMRGKLVGEKNGMYGKTLSKETKKILSEKCGRPGELNGMYGRKGKEAPMFGITPTNARKVVIFKDGELYKEYETVTEAAGEFKSSTNAVSKLA